MSKNSILFLSFLLFSFLPKQQNFELSDLIPKDTWHRTGIYKLSDQEKIALKDEILNFLLLYKRSLTEGVAVIAPSVSTSIKAREIRMQLKLNEIPFRYAEKILVVVRSTLSNPLMYSYDSCSELKKDAEFQLNISGPHYHIYIYAMNDDLKVIQISHNSIEAEY